MRFMLFLLVACCAARAAGQEPASFLLFREHGVVKLLGSNACGRADAIGLAPFWSIERPEGHSNAYFERRGDCGLFMRFAIDLYGPPWLYVEVTIAENKSVTVEVTHSVCGHCSTAYYLDYDALLRSRDDEAEYVRGMLERCGQNPLLPERAGIALSMLQEEPRDSASQLASCQWLITQLDTDSYPQRESVSRRLRQADLIGYLSKAAEGMVLTPEQDQHVRMILQSCVVAVDERIVRLLRTGKPFWNDYNPLPWLWRQLGWTAESKE